MEKEEKIPYPIQCGSSVSEYIKMIKLHAISVGEDLDGIDIKVKFICELSLVNTLKNLLSYNACTPVRQKYADRMAILIFAYNEKENIYANQYLYFFLSKHEKNVKERLYATQDLPYK